MALSLGKAGRTRSGLGIALLLLSTPLVLGTSCTTDLSDLESIQAAIDSALPGATIRIGAGTFLEQIVIDRGDITLVGSGSSTVIRFPGSVSDDDRDDADAADDDRLAVILVRGVDCSTGGPQLRNIRVENGPADGLVIRNSSNCSVEGIVASGNAESGIVVRDSSDVSIAAGSSLGCDVFGNGDEGIDVRGSTDVSIDGCTVDDNASNGVRARDGSQRASIANSDLLRNGDHGLMVRDSSDVALRSSVASGNRDDGVRVRDSARATLDDNEISSNLGSGLRVRDSSDVDVTNNDVLNNSEYGIRTENSALNLSGNTVSGNGEGDFRND